MKKKPVKRRWPYFFGQRIQGSESGNVPELIKTDSEWQRTEGGMKDILRWADDGGKTLDPGELTAGLGSDDMQKQSNTTETKRERKPTRKVSENNDSLSQGS